MFLRSTFIAVGMFIASAALAAPKVGDRAPDFSLPGHDGKTYSLSDLKGKYVVLEWFNNECPYVEKHYNAEKKNMQTIQKTWIDKAVAEKKDLVWLTIVSSKPGSQGYVTAAEAKNLKDNVRKANMTAMLLDPDGKVGRAYDAKVTPHMFIIDPQGTLRYDGAIDDQPSAKLSSLKGAKNYVNNALASLFEGKNVAETKTTPYGCTVKY